MKSYYRIMLGAKSIFADECYQGNFIGVDFLWDIDLNFLWDIDLTGNLPENWKDFNKKFIPIYLEKNPGKTKITAGLACGNLWTYCKRHSKRRHSTLSQWSRKLLCRDVLLRTYFVLQI